MYQHLRGRLTSADPAYAVVECGGVGYRVRVPLSTFERLPAAGEECTILTHLHVREDAMELYGFLTEGERTLFRKLVSISGVGPAAALAMLSHQSVQAVVAAIRRGDAAPLTKAKGIGRKIAARVVLELKGAVAELEALVGVPAAEAGAEAPEVLTAQGLEALGYSESDAARVAKEAVEHLGADAAPGELLREALKRIR
jgi:Holliday junction DNA helicase RuvA